jgi:hypothetical protein
VDAAPAGGGHVADVRLAGPRARRVRLRADQVPAHDVVKGQKRRQHSLLTANADEGGNVRTGKNAFVVGARAACAFSPRTSSGVPGQPYGPGVGRMVIVARTEGANSQKICPCA